MPHQAKKLLKRPFMSLIGTVYHNGIDKLCKQTKCFSLTGGTFNYFFSVILYATQAGIYM